MSTVNSTTSIAAIFFSTDTDTHIRVLYQNDDGSIREGFYDHSAGWATRDNNLVGNAQKGTGLAAITWNNGGEVGVSRRQLKRKVLINFADSSLLSGSRQLYR